MESLFDWMDTTSHKVERNICDTTIKQSDQLAFLSAAKFQKR